jgi:type VI secretion system protein ImpC
MSDAAAQAQAAGATTQDAAPQDAGKAWLEQAIATTRPLDESAHDHTKTYIEQFIAQAVKPGQTVSKDVETSILYWIKEIDRNLSNQLNEVMHNPAFQKLESTWRGLHYLVHQSETGETLKIRVLNATKKELSKDLEKAVEFDQSSLFKKIYEEEYGMYGGEPFGLLVGDYEFDHSAQDVKLLQKMSNVAAASHAPFVATAGARLFGLETFTELPNPRDLAMKFQSVEYAAWKSYRDSEDSRYVALTLPHVLARLPYGAKFKPVDEFNFEEDVDGKSHDKYLWMSPAWAYASRITDAFSKDGWFGRIRGPEGGGKVEGLPVHTFPTDDGDLAMKCPTEIAITDRREAELSELGFLGLLHCKNTDYAAFFGAQSNQKPKKYFDPDANANAELSTKFNYLLCVSRFAHYLKVMARNKIGSYMEAKDCEKWLNSWINNYVISNPEDVDEGTKAKSPLAAAQVKVEEVPGKPGWYEAVAWLRPHFQLEGLRASMRLVARLPQKGK